MARRNLFVSDVDNTLLGDDGATRRFAAWVDEHRDRLLVVYNSGRFVASVLESVAETDLPQPDAVIGGVGTQIYFPAEDSFLGSWPPTSESWNTAAIAECLEEFTELELQPIDLQSAHKVSYYAYDLAPLQLDDIAARLDTSGFSTKVVYSSQRDLDVLPAGTGKGAATAHLAEFWDFEPSATIVAGDSGNDLAMFQHGFRGIVVGNAHAELRALDGEHIYHAQRHFADGVVEGLAQWLERS